MNLIQVTVPEIGSPELTGDQGFWLPALNWVNDYQNAVVRNGVRAMHAPIPSAYWQTIGLPPCPSQRSFAVWRGGEVKVAYDLPGHLSDGWVLGVTGEGYDSWAKLDPPAPFEAVTPETPKVLLCDVSTSDSVLGFSDTEATLTVTQTGIVTPLASTTIWEAVDHENASDEGLASDLEPFVKIVWIEASSQLLVCTPSWVMSVDEATSMPSETIDGVVKKQYFHEPGWEILATLASLRSFQLGSLRVDSDGNADVMGEVTADDFYVEVAGPDGEDDTVRVSLVAIAEAFDSVETQFSDLAQQFDSLAGMQAEQTSHHDSLRQFITSVADGVAQLEAKHSMLSEELTSQGRSIQLNAEDLERLEQRTATIESWIKIHDQTAEGPAE